MLTEDSAINVPAVGAAHVIKRYTAQASDEISFEVRKIVHTIVYLTLYTLEHAHLLHTSWTDELLAYHFF